MGGAASFHRHQAARALGEEFGEPGALDLAALNLSGLRIDDVQLEYGLGQVQANDGQICGRLHEGPPNAWL